MDVRLTFLGASGTVTGSRFLLETHGERYLVDCGLFQGGRPQKEMNWHSFPVPPENLTAIFLTHAHIDHAGYLPRLVREGFRGPVYATEATCALLEILLPDAAHLQEQDAAYANKTGYSRHKPALPLYTVEDVAKTLPLLRPIPFHRPQPLNSGAATWRPAGHILGSAWLEWELSTPNGFRRLVFSGDLGRYDQAVMASPHPIEQADVLVVESTYGGRRHDETPIEEILAPLIRGVFERKGILLIPSFAVGRTQQILYHIRRLQEAEQAPNLPVFIDSPMAVDASHIYCRFGDDHNLDINLLMDERECPLRCRDTNFVRDVEESKALNHRSGPAIIISASGMCTGGRILHHLKWRLPEARNAVLFVGYQAEGSRGRLLLEGARKIKIHGERVPVRAQIARIEALSGHGDHDEIRRWLSGLHQPPQRTFVVHGEPQASSALAGSLAKEGWAVAAPQQGDAFTLP